MPLCVFASKKWCQKYKCVEMWHMLTVWQHSSPVSGCQVKRSSQMRCKYMCTVSWGVETFYVCVCVCRLGSLSCIYSTITIKAPTLTIVYHNKLSRFLQLGAHSPNIIAISCISMQFTWSTFAQLSNTILRINFSLYTFWLSCLLAFKRSKSWLATSPLSICSHQVKTTATLKQ